MLIDKRNRMPNFNRTIYSKSKSWYTLVINSGVAFRSTLEATDYIYMYSVVFFCVMCCKA